MPSGYVDPMSTYVVRVHFRGSVLAEVEATDENDALQEAIMDDGVPFQSTIVRCEILESK